MATLRGDVGKESMCRLELLMRFYSTFLKLGLRAEQKPSLAHNTVLVLRYSKRISKS